MSDEKDSGGGCSISAILFGIPTTMIGYHWHGSVFWAVCDFFFWPLAWCKWLIFHEVNARIIRETFTWFFQ